MSYPPASPYGQPGGSGQQSDPYGPSGYGQQSDPYGRQNGYGFGSQPAAPGQFPAAPPAGPGQYGANQVGGAQFGANQFGSPFGQNPYALAPLRPGTVKAAGIITWIASGFGVIIGLAIAAVGGSVSGSQELADVLPGGANTLVAIGLGFAAWCAATIVLAAFMWRGRKGAAFGLAGMGAVYVLASIVSVVVGESQAQIGLGVILVAAASALAIVNSSRAWYDQQASVRR